MYCNIGRNDSYLLRNIQRGFTQMLSCCERWNIKIIEDKMQAIYFFRGLGGTESHLTLKQRYIPSLSQVKYLGTVSGTHGDFYRND